MSLRPGCACAFVLVASTAAAQSNTEAGIRALLRGDRQTAVRVLRPLAEDEAHPDPAAQFFFALAVDAQPPHGDNVRACGLFLHAANQGGPFAEQSAALAFAIRQQELSDAPGVCVAEEHWQGGPPQAFVLGPEHRIVFTDTSITVTYGGEDQRSLVMMPPGDVLRIEYTPLDVTRPAVARRHFFQWIGWFQDSTAPSSSWELDWTLIEVVGDRWIQVAFEKGLQVAQGATRPASRDVSGVLRLRVNTGGEAEYAVTAGPATRSVTIPWQRER